MENVVGPWGYSVLQPIMESCGGSSAENVAVNRLTSTYLLAYLLTG